MCAFISGYKYEVYFSMRCIRKFHNISTVNMQYSLIKSFFFVVVFVVVFENLDASPNPGRIPFCTPNLGIEFNFPTRIPNRGIRCLRSIDQDGSMVNLPSSDHDVLYAVKEPEAVEKGLLNSPLLNERHFIQSPNEDISEVLHAINADKS